MNNYITYYSFFSENAKILKDVSIDFETEKLADSGFDFEKAYTSFLNKYLARCRNFANDTFRSSSRIISNYISEIEETRKAACKTRFDALMELNSAYMRRTM